MDNSKKKAGGLFHLRNSAGYWFIFIRVPYKALNSVSIIMNSFDNILVISNDFMIDISQNYQIKYTFVLG